MNRHERRKRMVMGFGASEAQQQKFLDTTFHGEMMRCVLCGKKQQHQPGIDSQWRVVDVDGHRFYGCPAEFPKDPATVEAYEAAYLRFMERAIEVMRGN